MNEEQRFLAGIREEQGTVFLTLDSGEVLELAPESVPGDLPAVGESIDSPLLSVIRLAAERKKVARRIFSLLDRRLLPVSRVRRKLTEEGFSDLAVSAVLERMAEQGLYSDSQYARAYCRDCLRGRQVGRLYLEKKLREKQVPPDVAASIPAEILDRETEDQLALAAARNRWRRGNSSDPAKTRARTIRFLMGRGFPAGTVHRVVRQVIREHEDQEPPGLEEEA